MLGLHQEGVELREKHINIELMGLLKKHAT